MNAWVLHLSVFKYCCTLYKQKCSMENMKAQEKYIFAINFGPSFRAGKSYSVKNMSFHNELPETQVRSFFAEPGITT